MPDATTKPNQQSVDAFLRSVADEAMRHDCQTVLAMMQRVTKAKPTMWGPGMIGFDSYHYRYASGHEGDCFVTGFAPRKSALTLYIMAGFSRYDALMKKLGKHKTGKSCLYIRKLSDVDLAVLEDLVRESVSHVKQAYP